MFGSIYLFFVRLDDLIGLILSQIVTLFGTVEWTSAHEIMHRNQPARFMRWSHRKQLLNQFNGGFLIDGKVGRLSRRASFQSLVTTGGMGTGKSANLIIPNILTADDCSLVITDTSGELYEQTSGALQAKGYAIKVLNLIEPARSHGYNPLAAVADHLDAEKVAHILVSAKGHSSHEPIWDDGAKRLLRILIRTLKTAHGESATLAEVLRLLNRFDAHTGGKELNSFIIENTLNDPATFDDYRGFTMTAPEKMLLSFVSTAATALSLVGNPEIARMMARHDFDFSAMKEKKTALFVLVRQQDMGAYAFLLSLFYTELCGALLRDTRGRLPVYMLLDEFGHLTIPGFETFATTARKYKVGFWLILRSLSQLADRYGQAGARTILGGVGTETFFGDMDLDTAQGLSGRLGTAFRLNVFKPSAGLQQQPLMRPDQLIRMADNDLLMLHSNKDPVMVRTLPFYLRGDLRKLASMEAAELPWTPEN